HWIDESWQLQKRVLDFVHIPPPRRGLEIANVIWHCLEDWGIDGKIHTISVDNASANDSTIENLKIYVKNKRRLLCEGKLFHVRCCAHILNLITQDGLFEIKDIVDVIRDSVEWNSTYEMLAAAIKFKDVFPRLAYREPHYDICPSAENWTKTEKVCSVLELFWTAMHIVFGRDYPTSNLFHNEVSRVKVLVAALDPRCKLRALEFCFPRLYFSENVERQITIIRKTLYELYSEYVAISNIEDKSIGEGQRNKLSNRDLANVETQSGWSEYAEYLKSVESIQPQKIF
ncbi:UNVERIFIED_CONTAM: hypothetical protein Sindi_1983700, partial [Sesamum indicum]